MQFNLQPYQAKANDTNECNIINVALVDDGAQLSIRYALTYLATGTTTNAQGQTVPVQPQVLLQGTENRITGTDYTTYASAKKEGTEFLWAAQYVAGKLKPAATVVIPS
jgi:hypothetical protein